MKMILLCLFLMGCSDHYGADNVLNWHSMQEGTQKEYCRKCAKDADVNDCNICAGYKNIPLTKNGK